MIRHYLCSGASLQTPPWGTKVGQGPLLSHSEKPTKGIFLNKEMKQTQPFPRVGNRKAIIPVFSHNAISLFAALIKHFMLVNIN